MVPGSHMNGWDETNLVFQNGDVFKPLSDELGLWAKASSASTEQGQHLPQRGAILPHRAG